MKKIWDYLVDLADAWGRARAAAYMARCGDYEAMRRIMAEERKS